MKKESILLAAAVVAIFIGLVFVHRAKRVEREKAKAVHGSCSCCSHKH